jgi:hypothetical protein
MTFSPSQEPDVTRTLPPTSRAMAIVVFSVVASFSMTFSSESTLIIPPVTRGDSAVNQGLVLCSFKNDYEPNWNHLANELVGHYRGAEAVRMLDVHSPRLVGQALYEGIRWAQTCVVDWTGWRANVFFELGVRLACADVGPVGLIERGAADATAAHDAPAQRQQLMALFGPNVYRLAEEDDAVVRLMRTSGDEGCLDSVGYIKRMRISAHTRGGDWPRPTFREHRPHSMNREWRQILRGLRLLPSRRFCDHSKNDRLHRDKIVDLPSVYTPGLYYE